tara:strand:- start:2120 stop:2533 length:414 start_codon:yes stop_codon:yes gene_type:complete
MPDRSYTDVIKRLRLANLRPTRQRIGLGKLLFTGEERHFTADQLHVEADRAGLSVSLATVYNTLHQFCETGLLLEVVVDPSRSYFDTNTERHHHFFNPEKGELSDIPADGIDIEGLPAPPPGTRIGRVDIVVRIHND